MWHLPKNELKPSGGSDGPMGYSGGSWATLRGVLGSLGSPFGIPIPEASLGGSGVALGYLGVPWEYLGVVGKLGLWAYLNVPGGR